MKEYTYCIVSDPLMVVMDATCDQRIEILFCVRVHVMVAMVEWKGDPVTDKATCHVHAGVVVGRVAYS